MRLFTVKTKPTDPHWRVVMSQHPERRIPLCFDHRPLEITVLGDRERHLMCADCGKCWTEPFAKVPA